MSTNINKPAPANLDTSSLDVLRPLPFNPEPIAYKGTFISKGWDIQEKDGKTTVKDLVVKVALEEKDELDQQVVVERRYNMFPRARGVSDFKKDMASYLGYRVDKDNNIDEFPPRLLARQSLIELDGKPVRVVYEQSTRGKCATFKTFLPVDTTPAEATPAESAPAATTA
jgi:hypothetical protein